MIPKEKDLYVFLQKAGYILIFKEVVYNDIGEPKRNCDTNLVLEAVKDYYEKSCDKQILVASDGDYACLAKFLKEKNGLKTVLSPSLRQKCSILLKRLNVPIVFLYDVKNKVEMKKPPLRTEP